MRPLDHFDAARECTRCGGDADGEHCPIHFCRRCGDVEVLDTAALCEHCASVLAEPCGVCGGTGHFTAFYSVSLKEFEEPCECRAGAIWTIKQDESSDAE